MISSSNFFQKNLFNYQQKIKNKYALPPLKKDSIAPWQAQEDHFLDVLPQQKPLKDRVKKKAKKKQSRLSMLQSNLLKNDPVPPPLQPDPKLSPSLTVFRRVPLNIKCKVNEGKIKKDSSYDSISIRQFLSQQRVELMRLKGANRQTIDSDYQSNHFFRNRNSSKNRSIDSHNITLDLKRQLLQPLQIFDRKSMVSINPNLRKQKLQLYKVVAQKYNPLYEHRYGYD